MNNELENNIGIPEALAYEKEYKTLLEQVKGKSTSEKIDFLIPYIEEIRDRMDSLIACDDYDATAITGLIPASEENILLSYRMHAFIIVYRYEHQISILDDLHLERSGEFLNKYIDEILDLKYEKLRKERETLKRNNPKQYMDNQAQSLKEMENNTNRLLDIID